MCSIEDNAAAVFSLQSAFCCKEISSQVKNNDLKFDIYVVSFDKISWSEVSLFYRNGRHL